MNIIEMEVPFAIEAKTCGCKEKRADTFSIVDSFDNLCLDKKDIMLAEIQACQRILKYTKDRIDQIILEREIAELKLALDLLY